MKILILQDRLRLGGTETQALALGAQWLDAGHDVRLVVFRAGGELAESPAAKKLQAQVLQPLATWLDGWAPGLEKTAVELAPDVVMAFGREANAKLLRLQKLTPRPRLVATLRSGRAQPARYWRALRGAEAVIANAQWAAEEVVVHGVARENTHVIYNGLAHAPRVADAAAARADWRRRAGTPEGAVVLLCVAQFRRAKRQDILLRAVAQLPPEPPWQLWFAGDGRWLEPCKKIAHELKLHDRVRFSGVVADPAPLYAAADAAVLTSEVEGLPNFLIEAQAAGLPVVATTVGGSPECFVEGRTGLGVPAGNPARTRHGTGAGDPRRGLARGRPRPSPGARAGIIRF